MPPNQPPGNGRFFYGTPRLLLPSGCAGVMNRHARRRTRWHEPKSRHELQRICVPAAADTELGLAMLIAEDEEGHHEPSPVASTINEAKEIAESDLRSRMRRIELEKIGDLPVHLQGLARGIDATTASPTRSRTS